MKTDDISKMLYDNYKNNMKFHGKEHDIITYDKWLLEVFNNKHIPL